MSGPALRPTRIATQLLKHVSGQTQRRIARRFRGYGLRQLLDRSSSADADGVRVYFTPLRERLLGCQGARSSRLVLDIRPRFMRMVLRIISY